jgi:hypothetical protein
MKSGSSNAENDMINPPALVPQTTPMRTVSRRRGAGLTTVYTDSCPAPANPNRVEHDPAKHTLRLDRPDGTTISFRDQPVRFLVVEPDSNSGKLRLAVSMGKAKVIYLCPEVVE